MAFGQGLAGGGGTCGPWHWQNGRLAVGSWRLAVGMDDVTMREMLCGYHIVLQRGRGESKELDRMDQMAGDERTGLTGAAWTHTSGGEKERGWSE